METYRLCGSRWGELNTDRDVVWKPGELNGDREAVWRLGELNGDMEVVRRLGISRRVQIL